jgi:hypothetical protein
MPGAHSRQKSLKRVGDSSVYLTVCWIERCPSTDGVPPRPQFEDDGFVGILAAARGEV